MTRTISELNKLINNADIMFVDYMDGYVITEIEDLDDGNVILHMEDDDSEMVELEHLEHCHVYVRER